MEKLDQLVGPICCCTVTVGDLCMKGIEEVEDVLQLMEDRIADNMVLGMVPFALQTAY